MPTAKQLPRREIAAICPPGLEPIVAEELRRLGWSSPRTGPGLVTTTGAAAELYNACLHSRTATDLRVRVGRLKANSLEGLAQGLAKLPWSLFVPSGQAVTVQVSSRGSRLKRKDAVARKTELAIRDAIRGPRVQHRPGARRHHGQQPIPVHLRLEGDRVEASMDPVGEALWKRGYRSRGGAAPLRENVAAAALAAMGWAGRTPLVDPFCGSGTLLIEAAAMARGLAPGAERSFAFQRWPCHNQRLWRQLRAQHMPGRAASAIQGSDADERVLTTARNNADKAKVGRDIRWVHQRVDDLRAPAGGPGLVLANPPWGHRLGARVGGLYHALGQVLRAHFLGWELALLCPDRQLIRALRIPMEPRVDFAHGGGRLTLWAGRIPKGDVEP